MKLVTYQINGQPQLGALQGNQVIDLRLAYRAMQHDAKAPFPEDMITLLMEGQTGLDRVAAIIEFVEAGSPGLFRRLDDIVLLPPVLQPGKVVALGRNYAAHAKEGGSEPPQYPMLFHKTAGALLGAGGTIVIPPITTKVDYEGELAIIIGKTCL